MTRLFGWLAGTLLLLGLAAGGLLLAALDSKPLVERSETISQVAINQARWLFHTNDPRRPEVNRPTQGVYALGSTMKTVTATAAVTATVTATAAVTVLAPRSNGRAPRCDCVTGVSLWPRVCVG